MQQGRHQDQQRRRAEFRALLARRRGVADPEAYEVLDLPSQRAPVVRMSERRRARLRAHLEALLERIRSGPTEAALEREAVEGRDWRRVPPQPVAAAAQRTVARGCTLCKGHCCGTGADHAWLDTAALRRQIEAHPDRNMPAIVDRYMAAVPSRTYRGSCIYHGATGCTLPRRLRSDVCNNFFCRPMLQFRADAAVADAVQVFLIVRDARGSPRGRFVSERDEPSPQ